MPDLSYRMKKLDLTTGSSYAERAKEMIRQGTDVVNLAGLEPDYELSYEARESAISAVRDGHTGYSSVQGLSELREAVAHKLKTDNKIEASMESVVITTGSKFSVFAALQALINPDDEVLLIAPYWSEYAAQIKLAGGVPKIIQTTEDDGFKADIDEIEKYFTSRVKGIILNSPNNPTGMSYTEEELRAIGEIAVKKDVFIISDEIFEYFSYDKPHISIASISKKIAEQTVTIGGFSKSHSIPGWRVGYLQGSPDVVKAISMIQQLSTLHPNNIAQMAALSSLKDSRKYLDKMVQEFKERRDYLVGALNALHGFRCQTPDGGFCLYPNVQYYLGNEVGGTVPNNTTQFAEVLLNKAKVAVAPGNLFGLEGFVRMSLCQPMSRLQEAVARINSVLEK